MVKRITVTGVTPLHFAANLGNEECLKLLVEAGADVNFLSRNGYNERTSVFILGRTPLMCAIEGGHAQCVNKLIKAGVDVNAKDNAGYTALMIACRKTDDKLIEILLKAGTDVNTKSALLEVISSPRQPYYTEKGPKHLMSAAQSDFTKCINILIKEGADVNAETTNDLTALVYAAADGFVKSVKILVEVGADVNARHKNGSKVLQVSSYMCQETSEGWNPHQYIRYTTSQKRSRKGSDAQDLGKGRGCRNLQRHKSAPVCSRRDTRWH